jgi:ribosomal protein L40E
MLIWAGVGAIIGWAAASSKGFSVAGGVLGGVLLGPLAFLLFFVSGVSSANERRKCPYCAEWVKNEARVCKHCGKDLPPTPTYVTRKGRCRKCGAGVPPGAEACPQCKSPIPVGSDLRVTTART